MESDAFSISSISIEPEVSEIETPVRISMDFISPFSINEGIWKVLYQVDTIRKRKLFEVCCLEGRHFNQGVNSIEINIPGISPDSTSGITAGVLVLSLSSGNEELLGINMIVQVMSKEGRLFKTIFSPLE